MIWIHYCIQRFSWFMVSELSIYIWFCCFVPLETEHHGRSILCNRLIHFMAVKDQRKTTHWVVQRIQQPSKHVCPAPSDKWFILNPHLLFKNTLAMTSLPSSRPHKRFHHWPRSPQTGTRVSTYESLKNTWGQRLGNRISFWQVCVITCVIYHGHLYSAFWNIIILAKLLIAENM